MKRRKFLWITAATSLVILFPVYSCNSGQKLNKTAAIPLTLAHLISSENILQIGVIYRSLFKDENRTYLEDILIHNSDHKNLSKNDVINLISEKINQDFKNNNIIIIDGWALSRTEAQQCALYSFIN